MAIADVSNIVKGQMQTLSSQPVTTNPEPETSLVGGDQNAPVPKTNLQDDTTPESKSAPAGEGNTPSTNDKPAGEDGDKKETPIEVKLSPDALRQITALSASNRKLKQQLTELETKSKANATPEDIQTKLKRADELEKALTDPKLYLKLANKTLEDVAAAALKDDYEVEDPRVTALQEEIAALKAKTEEVVTKQTTDQSASQRALEAKQIEASKVYIKNYIDANPNRWELARADADISGQVLQASILVAKAKFTNKDGTPKDITKEQANKIIEDCLDEAEIMKLAEKMVKDGKTSLQAEKIPSKSRGLEVQDSTSYAGRKGDDGKQVNGRTPRVTIDANRGGVRIPGVERGPTDVRTARARALRIAGAGKDD